MAFLMYTCFRRMSSQYPVIVPRAAVVSDEMMASVAGLDVLRRGGNAADAALAMAASMQVLQPYSTGIGGDCFSLHYDASTKVVRCVDGCGRSPAALTLDLVESKSLHDWTPERCMHGLQATVPGAAKAWFYIASRFGSGKRTGAYSMVVTHDTVFEVTLGLRNIHGVADTDNVGLLTLSMSELLAPAIRYAEDGVPMDHVKWATFRLMLNNLQRMPGGHFFLGEDNQAPAIGTSMVNRRLAALLKELGKHGPQVVYEGAVAKNIAEAVHQAGGVMSTQDLSDHLNSTEPLEVEPVSTTYRDVTVHTTPLPTQGAVLLQVLNILERVGLKGSQHISGQFEHVVIEALRCAMSDGLRYIGDSSAGGSLEEMLSRKRARECADTIKLDRRVDARCLEGSLSRGYFGTTFMAAADDTGNLCALMGSNSQFFGCAVVTEHGFCVQSRGVAFNRVPGHPNCFGPRKKPYHSVMPTMITSAHTKDWLGTMGTMAGLPQPGIITQLLLNMVELGLDPQQSLSKPRFIVGSPFDAHPEFLNRSSPVYLDPSFPLEAQDTLKRRGHVLHLLTTKQNFHQPGHANIWARPSLWTSKGGVSISCPKPIDDNFIWCGTEPRINGIGLGY